MTQGGKVGVKGGGITGGGRDYGEGGGDKSGGITGGGGRKSGGIRGGGVCTKSGGVRDGGKEAAMKQIKNTVGAVYAHCRLTCLKRVQLPHLEPCPSRKMFTKYILL